MQRESAEGENAMKPSGSEIGDELKNLQDNVAGESEMNEVDNVEKNVLSEREENESERSDATIEELDNRQTKTSA